ncbi:MAG: MCP four helix bundle domain-containing protein, partial [Chloroflexota bacterium]
MRLNVKARLLGSSAILIALMALIGGIAVVNLGSVNQLGASMYGDRTAPIRDLGQARAYLGDIDSQIQRNITTTTHSPEYATAAAADATGVDKLIVAYEATSLVQAEKDGLVIYHTDWTAYQAAYKAVLDAATAGDDAKAISLYFDTAAPLYNKTDGSLATLVKVNDEEALKLQAQIASTYQSGLLITIVAIVIGAIIGFALSFWLARKITSGVKKVQDTLEMLSEKCATWLAEGMEKLRDNDLTYAVTPVTPLIEHYGTDEIGKTAEYTNAMRN